LCEAANHAVLEADANFVKRCRIRAGWETEF
jgi:hypothetical protein